MKNIAIFASGNGSNAESLTKYFNNGNTANVKLIVCNNKNALVLQRAKNLNIEALIMPKEHLCSENPVELLEILESRKIDYIILAGYLLKIPLALVNKYTHKIINIHPALLPKYGGKGMYGMNIHKAVVEAKEKETGITIHLIDEIYDNGEVIFQTSCSVEPDDTPEIVAKKISLLEQTYFPKVVEEYILSGNR
ncbi:MAG: phosphoribosylglycinamide formyltransferase [Bacteroidales bacterium]|jgi:phosphoribosylglycinamide formyltransferase-1|nr:phosphoribosylglycinamide formyltransferase [Bacteroidales bacterium]